jgi:Zn-dependent M28 family amino/carboxypeptidase
LPYEVVIVLFDGEDFGLTLDEFFLGSKYFADNMGDYRPKEAVVVDMVGDADLRLLRETNSLLSNAPLVDSIWEEGTKLGFPQYSNAPGPAILDDHIPLIQAGIPSVDIIDLDYPYWHTLADTTDKCSQDSLLAVGEVLYHLIAEGKL